MFAILKSSNGNSKKIQIIPIDDIVRYSKYSSDFLFINIILDDVNRLMENGNNTEKIIVNEMKISLLFPNLRLVIISDMLYSQKGK